MSRLSSIGNDRISLKSELERLISIFEKIGSNYVEIPTLLQSDLLRPDFTVPIVQLHIKTNTKNAQYCYSGKVWRKQDYLSSRPSEYLQVGIECFGGSDIAKEDAKLFSTISKAVGFTDLKIVTGDLGVLRSAINGLEINQRCKNALLRQLWRPKRFLHVLKYFSNSIH